MRGQGRRPGGGSAAQAAYGRGNGLAPGKRSRVVQRYGGARAKPQGGANSPATPMADPRANDETVITPDFHQALRGTTRGHIQLAYTTFSDALHRHVAQLKDIAAQDAKMKAVWVQIATGVISPYIANGIAKIYQEIRGKLGARPATEVMLAQASNQARGAVNQGARFANAYMQGLHNWGEAASFIDQIRTAHLKWVSLMVDYISMAPLSNAELIGYRMLYDPSVQSPTFYESALAELLAQHKSQVENMDHATRGPRGGYRYWARYDIATIRGPWAGLELQGLAQCVVSRWNPSMGVVDHGPKSHKQKARFVQWIAPAMQGAAIAKRASTSSGKKYPMLDIHVSELENPGDVDFMSPDSPYMARSNPLGFKHQELGEK